MPVIQDSFEWKKMKERDGGTSLKKTGVRYWRALDMERIKWRSIVKKAKTHKGIILPTEEKEKSSVLQYVIMKQFYLQYYVVLCP